MVDDNKKPLGDTRENQIEELKTIISAAEKSLEEARRALATLTGDSSSFSSATPSKVNPNLNTPSSGKIVEGVFDGENMLGPDGKIYPVPANYASKSKLIEGDRLKLTIAEDGSFIFKQIGPAERKKIIGELHFENNIYSVLAEGKSYNVLYASVTYFKAKAGDRVTIVVPATEECKWAAIENIIHDMPKEETTDPDDILNLDEEVGGVSFLEPEQPSIDGAAPINQVTETQAPQINSVPTQDAPMDKPVEALAPVGDLPEFPEFDEKRPEDQVATAMSGVLSPDDVFGEAKLQSAQTEPAPQQPAMPANEIEI